MTSGTLNAVRTGVLVLLLVPACIQDWKTRQIPNRWPLALGLAGLALSAAQIRMTGWSPLVFSLVGALTAFGLGLLCRTLSKGGFGWGDIKLMSSLGAVLGLFPFLRGMALTGLFSLIAAVWLLLVRHKHTSDQVPFAPFLAIGAVLSEGLEWWMSAGGSL